MKQEISEVQKIMIEREKTFDQMKQTLSQSKTLIQKLQQAKNKFIASKNSQAQQNPNSCPRFCPKSHQIENQQAQKPKNSINLIIEKAKKPQKHSSLKKIDFIRQNIVGLCTPYTSPFNIQLESVYVDHTATSRAYTPIETVINYTKRFMANPHTEFSYFGRFSTEMMHYSLNSLLKSFSADPKKYTVLPTGSGSTGAFEKAIRLIQKIEGFAETQQIFITPYEHHSNILPWVEFYGGITNLECDDRTVLMMDKIEEQIKNSKRKNVIVSVSAASNVTSQLTDLKTLNAIIKKLRKVKNLIFAVDCAAYCCHHEFNVTELDEIDFAFISPHKNLGGAESCGLLLVKKSVISSSKPSFPGGGTVAMVKGYEDNDILYDTDLFNREVAGTPPFLGFYRAALSFELLKNDIGYDFIHEREKKNSEKFIGLLMEQNIRLHKEGLQSSIVIYGTCGMKNRANVFTINIVTNGEVKNHNLISQIMTDVFGIQVRSGCFCAGPFSVILLNLDKKMLDSLMPVVNIGMIKDKPGYIRMDMTFYLQEFQVEYIAKAIALTTRYSNNMDLIYTVCNDGQIRRNKIYQGNHFDNYALQNFILLGQKLEMLDHSDNQRLTNRRITLQNQLITGQAILKDPVTFLNAQLQSKKSPLSKLQK